MAETAAACAILQPYCLRTETELRSVDRMGSGGEARVYLAQLVRRGGGALTRVVKVYDGQKRSVGTKAANEPRLLAAAAALLRDHEYRGWRIRVPEVYFESPDPLGFVMELVPGIAVDALIRSRVGQAEDLRELADVIASGLAKFWQARGEIYGDVNLNNFLVDHASRTIYFLDIGRPSDDYLCTSVEGRFAPLSRDLGCLSFSVFSTNVRIGLLDRRWAARRAEFARTLILGSVRHSRQWDGEETIFEEIEACALAHIRRLRAQSRATDRSAVRRLWVLALANIATRRIRRELHEVTNDIATSA